MRDPLVALLLREPGEQQRQLHVLERGEHGQQVERTGTRSRRSARASRASCAGVIALTSAPPTRTRAAGGLVEPGDEVEQGGLARARRSHERGEAALLDVHREAGEDVDPLGVALEDSCGRRGFRRGPWTCLRRSLGSVSLTASLATCLGMTLRSLRCAATAPSPASPPSAPPPHPSPPAPRPTSPRAISRNPPLTGPASTARASSRPSRTSHTTLRPLSSRTAAAGSRNRGGPAGAVARWPSPESARRGSPPARPSRAGSAGSRSRMLTFTCTVARCRSAVGTTCRTSPRNDVSG